MAKAYRIIRKDENSSETLKRKFANECETLKEIKRLKENDLKEVEKLKKELKKKCILNENINTRSLNTKNIENIEYTIEEIYIDSDYEFKGICNVREGWDYIYINIGGESIIDFLSKNDKRKMKINIEFLD